MKKIWIAGLLLTLLTTPVSAETIKTATTQERQSKLTPDKALQKLKDGNKRFMAGKSLSRNYLKQAKQSSYGQYPWAVVLNCMDSRSVPELLFDTGLADLFTLRIAGNVSNPNIIGSMEFATNVAGSKLIVIMGHTSCGAISGACQKVKLGQLDTVLDKIQPAVAQAHEQSPKAKCDQHQFIDKIALQNVKNVMADIKKNSPLISEQVKNGDVKIIGAMHHLRTGEVEFFE